MKHLRHITLGILGMAVSATLTSGAFAQDITFVNPQSLANTAINNPSAVAGKAESTFNTGAQTSVNLALKDSGIGGSDGRALMSIGTPSFGTKAQNALTNDAVGSSKAMLQDAGLSGYDSAALSSVISNPGNIGGRLEGTLATDARTQMNAAMTDAGIGGADGRALMSIGSPNFGTNVQNALTHDAVDSSKAMLQDAGLSGFDAAALSSVISNPGNIAGRLQSTLTVDAQTQMNRLTSGGIPGLGGIGGIGIGAALADTSTPSSPTFVQKNTYVAATDDPNVYYGGGVGGIAGASTGFGSVGTVVSAVVTAATTGNVGNLQASVGAAQNSALHALSGSNQIVNASGVIMATYNPASGQFTNPTGAIISQTSADYNTYKSTLSSAATTTASLSTASIGVSLQ
jgi:hypothetical protein